MISCSMLLSDIAAAKPAKTSSGSGKTWGMLVEHVLKRGGEWPIKAPMSRTLGYDSDSVPAKSLGIEQEKSKDNREHSVFVVYEVGDKGVPRAKEVILANLQVTMKDGKRQVDGYDARATLDGKLVGGMRALGEEGKVIQTGLKADSPELKAFFASERDNFLNKLNWKKLSPE